MADEIRMPSGIGGLVRYFDDIKSKVTMSPEFVLVLLVAVVIVEYALHNFMTRKAIYGKASF
ncbi:preprotein translocase subunit Sec61beta [Candidatus Woesearchaeota archaeon]|nr:preprotein translocase subunit Sec61beta [Candidatus Woesearchaeota archaeon]